jgi:hypothetical protein
VAQLAEWRNERLDDAAKFAHELFATDAVQRWMVGSSREPSESIRERCRDFQSRHQYADVQVVDAGGQVRLSLSGNVGPLEGIVARALDAAWAERRPILADLHLDLTDPSEHVEVVAPFFADGGRTSVPAGALILRSDARNVLYPLIQSWPALSESAETLLVRRDGNDVLYLNELRHRHGTALKLRTSMNQADLPAAMAVRGVQGPAEGRDYRGVPVLAVLKAIPDSPWFMVAKIDKAEALAVWPSRSASILTIVAVVALVSAAVAVAVATIAHRRKIVRSTSLSAS